MCKLTEGIYALGALTFFAIWLFVVLPFLYGPPPRIAVSESRILHPGQSQSAIARPDGSETAPFIVKVQRSAEELDREELERKEKASTDWLLMAFTGAVAVFTLLLVLATVLLFVAGERQRRSSQEIATLQRESFEKVAAEQSNDMKQSISVATKSATEAKLANELSRELFISEQRPWLLWNVQNAVSIINDGRQLNITINGTIRNIGKTPALNVTYFGKFYSPRPNEAAIMNCLLFRAS